MISDKVKAGLIFEISGHKGEVMCTNLLKLLEILIQEVRVNNDTAGPETMRLNQGEIAGYMKLQDYIERGLPGAIKIP